MFEAGYIDAHCHLADRRFDGMRDAVLARAKAAGIVGFVQGGVDPADWDRQRALGPACVRAYGLHPWFVDAAPRAEAAAAFARLQARIGEATALGELGLDFSKRMNAERFSDQIEWFHKQLEMAKAHDKPLVLHLVQCASKALEILRAHAPLPAGIVHGFTGSLDTARAYLALGLCLSVGGGVARPGYKKVKAALKDIPEDRLVVESDAPDMGPAAYPRAPNEPESLLITAAAVGALRGQSREQVLASSSAVLRRIFRLE